MNAQTIRVNESSFTDAPVAWRDLRRTAQRWSATYQIIGVNGPEATLTRAQLCKRYPEQWRAIITASGNFAIVGEKWILILE